MTSSPPLAPRWHTALLVTLVLMVAVVGTWLTHAAGPAADVTRPASRAAAYAQLALVAWALLFYVARIGRPRSALRELLGEGWSTAARAPTDVALAAAAWLLIEACELGWMRLFATGTSATVAWLLPRSTLERVAWVLVSASVAFSEEVVYRGYLQAQLGAFTGRAVVACGLSAALFGIAHAEQGGGAVVRYAMYGLGLGALAMWRRSLWPGVIGHAWTNVASGLFHP